jgi:gluconate 2-dehydrogenase gamma chain
MSDSSFPPPSAAPVTRRTAVKLVAVTVAGAGVGAGGSALLTRLGDAAPPPYRFFTDTEAALVIELCEQIIPRDDVPGATDAGVVHYIDRQLSTRLARHRKAYREGLQAFAQSCVAAHGQPFAQLPVEKKIAFMRQVELGKVPAEAWKDEGPAGFFRLVVSHTMQGFYGSPRHGGNRDYVSYKILGIDYPQVIGRNRHRRT